VVDAVVAMIDNPDITLKEIMTHIPGPDFPTGGLLCGRTGIRQAYKTGRGKLVIRAVAALETAKSGKQSIIITELPYTVNKARLIEEIAELVQGKKIEGIADIRDESDREGMRLVIEIKRGENYEVILNNLYKHTRMQTTFGVILLALVNNQPVFLTLREALSYFIDHRREVIYRRTRFELRKAEARAHILEGLRIALDHIDEVIALIRASKDVDVARTGLMETFGLTRVQAQAILDMRLQRLTGLEREKIEEEYRDLIQAIERYRQILANPALVMEIMKEEILEMKGKFADARRTVIVDAAEDIDIEDLIAEENMVVTISHAGYVKRIPTSAYRQQHRGGRGTTAMQTKEEDFVEQIFIASTHHYILFFTSDGRVYRKKVYELPQTGRASKGKAIVNMLPLEKDVKVTAVLAVESFEGEQYAMMATRRGTVKKVSVSAFGNVRATGIIAIGLAEGDMLLSAQLTSGENEIILATQKGRAIRFREDDVRPMGRTAGGVRGIRLVGDDEVVGMVPAKPGVTLLTVCENGYGKRSDVADYRLIGRGGQGVLDIKTSARNGKVVGVLSVVDEDEVMMITQGGIAIRQPVSDISVIGRNTQGVRVIRLDEGDRLISVAKIRDD
jgi:DNA gyrase subunit A